MIPGSADPGGRKLGRRATATAVNGSPELRETILAATAALLENRRFSDLSVGEILAAAGIARGSFYFYFDGKYDVLAELVRRAVASGHEAAEPWLAAPPDRAAALRQGITAGVRLWRAQAPILRAIVENWRTEPRLTELWLDQMQTFTEATIAQLMVDPQATETLADHSVAAVASALTWLGERIYYLFALGTPPFDDEDVVIDTLLHIWTSTLYRRFGKDHEPVDDA